MFFFRKRNHVSTSIEVLHVARVQRGLRDGLVITWQRTRSSRHNSPCNNPFTPSSPRITRRWTRKKRAPMKSSWAEKLARSHENSQGVVFRDLFTIPLGPDSFDRNFLTFANPRPLSSRLLFRTHGVERTSLAGPRGMSAICFVYTFTARRTMVTKSQNISF